MRDLHQLAEMISHALSPSGDSEVDASGRTPFSITKKKLREIAQVDGYDDIVRVLIDVGLEGRDNDANWWLHLLDLFRAIKGLRRNQGLALVDAFRDSLPTDLVARAYLLRFLTLANAPIDWNCPPGDATFTDLLDAAPLVVVDVFVAIGDYASAEQHLKAALDRGSVADEDLRTAIAWWSETSGALARNFLSIVKAWSRKFEGRSKKPTLLSEARERAEKQCDIYLDQVSSRSWRYPMREAANAR